MNFFKQKALTALVLLVGMTPMNAQSTKIKFEEFDLDNGLHVILHEDHSVPIVAVTVLYHVGSKNENPNRTGFAHFFEHLLFEGSENINRGEFGDYIQNAGGMMNANTTQDRTFYYEVLPSNELELGLWLESERMLHAKVDEKGVETQRKVVKEERRQRVDNRPYGTLMEETFKRAYSEHPYQWSVIGSMDHLDAAKEADYIQFYKDFYIPNNATLSIAGDFNSKQAKTWIKKYFSTIPKGKEPYRPNIVEPPLKGEVRDVVYDNVQLPLVVQSYRIPKQGTEDYYAVKMLSTLLSGGKSSRLNKSLVDDQELAISSGSFSRSMEDPGLATSYAIANMGIDQENLEKAMEKEFEKVRTELISEKEFQKLKNQVENNFVTRNSRIRGIAESLANYHTYFGDANLINNELERYLKVTREDILRVAKKYFNKENRVVLHYLPKSAKP